MGRESEGRQVTLCLQDVHVMVALGPTWGCAPGERERPAILILYPNARDGSPGNRVKASFTWMSLMSLIKKPAELR